MNFHLAREIYGRNPLMVDRATFSTFLNLVTDLRNGVVMDDKGEKLNNCVLFDVKSETQVITNTRQLNQTTEDDMIYVINLNGPIIKNGGMSTYGTKDLAAMIRSYESDTRVKGGVIVADSGGGSSLGMEVLVHAIRNSKKPIVSLVERAGGAASAAYGIIAATDWIISESETSEVGSIGTMISIEGHPNKSVDSDGKKHITMYASASTKKNEWFEEAINNDNYEVAITELLDPYNERFMADVKSARPNILSSQMNGSVFNSGDVIGTMVDQIGTFSDAVNKVMELSKTPKYSNELINNKTIKNKSVMTEQEYKELHPESYQRILSAGNAAGVSAEKERVKIWMTYQNVDPEAVKKGIVSGEELSGSAREELLLKSAQMGMLSNLKADSAVDLKTKEAESQSAEKSDSDLLQEELNSILKPKS